MIYFQSCALFGKQNTIGFLNLHCPGCNQILHKSSLYRGGYAMTCYSCNISMHSDNIVSTGGSYRARANENKPILKCLNDLKRRQLIGKERQAKAPRIERLGGMFVRAARGIQIPQPNYQVITLNNYNDVPLQ